MPIVLDTAQFDAWMRGTPDQAAAMMKRCAGELEAWEVGTEVGSVRNNWPELMERVVHHAHAGPIMFSEKSRIGRRASAIVTRADVGLHLAALKCGERAETAF